MNHLLRGNAWKYGDNVDTDVIIPARYLNTSNPQELALHCMEDIDPTFAKEIHPNDVVVAGENFGCGSSREHAPIAIKASGIDLIIAKSFARIFYRNSINIGLPILESEECVNDAEAGDVISADLGKGIIRNETKGKEYTTTPFPEFIQEIINCGGLVGYAQQKL